MTWVFEDPTYAVIVAVIGATSMLIAFLRSGRRLYLEWLAGIVLLGAGLIVLERYVVTDRERVEQTLDRAKAGLEANDVEVVTSCLASSAEALEREVRARMREIEVRQANMADVRIEFSGHERGRTAIVSLIGRLEFKASGIPIEQYLGRFRITLVEERNQWLIQSYELKR
jgi:hypothetical protein